MDAIAAAGGNAFFDYQVPSAVITLKQGFGRLIRSLKDRGVLMLLDPRIQRQRYGRIFLDSLPPTARPNPSKTLKPSSRWKCESCPPPFVEIVYFVLARETLCTKKDRAGQNPEGSCPARSSALSS